MPKYKVAGPFSVLGKAPGETVNEADIPEGINLEALLAGGSLEVASGSSGEEEAPAKVACPACVEQELARPPKFDDLAKLKAHYADKHPALVAPETMPAEPEKED